MNKQMQSGQTMVEAMVALTVIVVGILAVFTLTSQSIALDRVAADRYVAVNLANEGIELVKHLIDKNVMQINDNIAWNAIPGFSCVLGSTCYYEIDYNDGVLISVNPSNARLLYFNKSGTGFYRYQEGEDNNPTTYKRVIGIKNIASDHIYISSKVSWKSRGGDYDFIVEDDFYNLQGFKYNNNINL